MPNHNVRLITQATNTKSPIVASFENLISITNKEGRMRAFVKATDLTNAEDIHDPITNQNLKQLPMDRYYGNYVYIEIDNDLRRTNPPVEKIEIPIRVLHVVKAESISSEDLSFDSHIVPLFSYYVRYYPWLHVNEHDDQYEQFFDVENYEHFRQLCPIVLTKLSKADDDPGKMPRSRDFPINGIELIKRWQASGMRK